MKKLEKASAKYDLIGNAMDAERQKIGGRSYDEVGRVLWSFERGMNLVSTLDAKAAAWFAKQGFPISLTGIVYTIMEG